MKVAERRQIERNLGRQIGGRKGEAKARQTEQDEDTDDNQPPLVRGNTWIRGRGGKKLGRPHKKQRLVEIEKKHKPNKRRKDSLGSEYIPSDDE
jgi:hypothetical protein